MHGLAAELGRPLIIGSQENAGTTVELWLSVGAMFQIEGGRFDLEGLSRSARGQVLLVDGAYLVRTSTADMLEETGCVVRKAVSAEHSLALVAYACARTSSLPIM